MHGSCLWVHIDCKCEDLILCQTCKWHTLNSITIVYVTKSRNPVEEKKRGTNSVFPFFNYHHLTEGIKYRGRVSLFIAKDALNQYLSDIKDFFFLAKHYDVETWELSVEKVKYGEFFDLKC